MRPVAPAAASSPRPASQASTAQASTVALASLKKPGRTTPARRQPEQGQAAERGLVQDHGEHSGGTVHGWVFLLLSACGCAVAA